MVASAWRTTGARALDHRVGVMIEGTATFTALQQQTVALHECYGALREAGFTQSEAIEYLVGITKDGH